MAKPDITFTYDINRIYDLIREDVKTKCPPDYDVLTPKTEVITNDKGCWITVTHEPLEDA